MEFLIYYALFCVTTTLAALYELFIPSIKQVQEKNPECMVSQYPGLSLFSLSMFGLFAAPFLFLPCVVPSYGARFRTALAEGLSTAS